MIGGSTPDETDPTANGDDDDDDAGTADKSTEPTKGNSGNQNSNDDDDDDDDDALETNNIPTGSPQSVTGYGVNPVAITLSGNDADGDSLTYELVDSPSNGSLSGIALPNLTYTADAGYYGADSFTFRVNDGAVNSATITVSITIQDWCHPDWAKRVPLAFDNRNTTIDSVSTGVTSEEMTDFRLLVSLEDPAIDFDQVLPNGQDIRFCDPDTGAFLDYEIESWDDTAKKAAIWVKVPKIDADSNTDLIHLYYSTGS